MIKLSEVPKGQKWQYLWDYYRFPALAAVIGLIFAVSLIKTIFFTPKADVGIIFTTELSLSDSEGEKFAKAKLYRMAFIHPRARTAILQKNFGKIV